MFDIAIIGFGATGVSLLKQIQDQVYASGLNPPQIAIFNPKSAFARGKAFGDADVMHKVNTPPSMLSISGSEPIGFTQWINEKENHNKIYPSRLIYSDFLQETYLDILKTGLLKIEEFHESAKSVISKTSYYQVSGENGNLIRASKIVLCLGSLHGSNFKHFSEKTGFIDHHSKISYLGQGPVLVAGTGLTAVDVFRSLNHQKNNEIHLFSRHGFAPTCLTTENRYTPKFLSWQKILSNENNNKLQHFLNILKQECKELGNLNERTSAMKILQENSPFQYFTFLMERSLNANLPYQDILVSTRPYMHKLWRSIPIEDKIYFNISFGADWAAWRYPVPYEVISELADASKNQRLFIHRANRPPRWENGNFILETTTGKTISAHYLIDGTGGTNQLNSINSPLLKNLLEQKLIEAHPCGGLDVNPLTFECQANGISTKNFYSLGPLNKGSLFSTNAFWFNSRCADHWVRQWIIEATNKNSTKA